jgi:hypothetical protein
LLRHAAKSLDLTYNLLEADSSINSYDTEVIAMGEDDTVILTPEDKEKILQQLPDEDQHNEDDKDEDED